MAADDARHDGLIEASPIPSESEHSQRRGDSALSASSDVVQALFGDSVGPCWGDFFCTHSRIRGRLYATSQAILFYTNLLGFERRLCLLFRDVDAMELFKTTSVRITMMDYETYVFKSFNDREQVLNLLSGLKILADRHAKEGIHIVAAFDNNSTALTTLRPAVSANTFLHGVSLPLPPPSTDPIRRRAVSDSILRLPITLDDSQLSVGGGSELGDEYVERRDESSFPMDDHNTSDAWMEAKEPKNLEEVGVEVRAFLAIFFCRLSVCLVLPKLFVSILNIET
jgi:hypothetical protein